MGLWDSFKESANKTMDNWAEIQRYVQEFEGKSPEELRHIINSSSGAKKQAAMLALKNKSGC